jgi:hypothetical protein
MHVVVVQPLLPRCAAVVENSNRCSHAGRSASGAVAGGAGGIATNPPPHPRSVRVLAGRHRHHARAQAHARRHAQQLRVTGAHLTHRGRDGFTACCCKRVPAIGHACHRPLAWACLAWSPTPHRLIPGRFASSPRSSSRSVFKPPDPNPNTCACVLPHGTTSRTTRQTIRAHPAPNPPPPPPTPLPACQMASTHPPSGCGAAAGPGRWLQHVLCAVAVGDEPGGHTRAPQLPPGTLPPAKSRLPTTSNLGASVEDARHPDGQLGGV